MDEPIWKLVDALAARQRELELNDREFATRLGVPRASWTAAKLRKYRPGLGFVQKVARSRGFAQLARPYLHGTAT